MSGERTNKRYQYERARSPRIMLFSSSESHLRHRVKTGLLLGGRCTSCGSQPACSFPYVRVRRVAKYIHPHDPRACRTRTLLLLRNAQQPKYLAPAGASTCTSLADASYESCHLISFHLFIGAQLAYCWRPRCVAPSGTHLSHTP